MHESIIKIMIVRATLVLSLGLLPTVLFAHRHTHKPAVKARRDFQPSQAKIAHALVWQPDLTSPCNLCKGAYAYNPAIESVLNPPKFNKAPSVITAQGESTLLPHNRSILRDHVVFKQKGRQITADKAYIYRNPKTGHLTDVQLFGHVHDLSAQGLIVSPYADINLEHHTGWFRHAIARHQYISAVDGMMMHSWSTATAVYRDAGSNLILKHHLQMSDCSPLSPTWVVHAGHGVLNHKKNRMKVYNVYITFHHVPIFYTPYLSFSLNKKRKSGLLFPKLGYSSSSGFMYLQPYYFNIAPNMDDLLKAGIYHKRGIDINNRFRWLAHWMRGILQFNWLPEDALFKSFKQATLPVLQQKHQTAYYDALKKSSNSRYSVALKSDFKLSPHWSSKLILNHVSDDYYLQDIASLDHIGAVIPDQLLNLASINYKGNKTSAAIFAEGYQTLHPAGGDATANQYQRFEGNYNIYLPNVLKRFTLSAQTEMTNFLMPNNAFSSVGVPIVDGTRMHMRGRMAMPMTFAAGYVTPSLSWDATKYAVNFENSNGKASALAGLSDAPARQTLTRAIPIVNIDSGLYLEKRGVFGHPHLLSTIMPEVSYLYVPYQNQQDIPIFDTILVPLSYDTLFSTNRFSGIDRMENADQFNVGIKTQLSSEDTGFTYLSFGVGMQYYMTPQMVSNLRLNPASAFTTQRLSPIVSELTWTPTAQLSTKVDLNWDSALGQTESATLSTTYHASNRMSLLAEYTYLGGNANIPPYGLQSKEDLYTLGITAPIGTRLQAFSYANYNAQNERMIGAFTGIQYDSCCWALRIAYTHNWESSSLTEPTNPDKDVYQNAIYFQFMLKGLSSFGTNLDALLKTDINGYNYR